MDSPFLQETRWRVDFVRNGPDVFFHAQIGLEFKDFTWESRIGFTGVLGTKKSMRSLDSYKQNT